MTRLERKGASCAGSKSDTSCFVEEHSLRGLAVHDAESLRIYHLPDVAGKSSVQCVGHQLRHTTRLRKRDVDSPFRQFHVGYHDLIKGNFLFC